MIRNPRVLLAAAPLAGGFLGWLAGAGKRPSATDATAADATDATAADAEGAAPLAAAHCPCIEGFSSAKPAAKRVRG